MDAHALLAASFRRSSTPSATASASDAAVATTAAARKIAASSSGFSLVVSKPLRPSLAFVSKPMAAFAAAALSFF
jgi:hypothetical protein